MPGGVHHEMSWSGLQAAIDGPGESFPPGSDGRALGALSLYVSQRRTP